MGKAVVIPSGCVLEPRLTRGVASYLLFDLISASRVPPHPWYSRGHGISGIAKATVDCISFLTLPCDRVGTCPKGTGDLL